MKTNKIQLKAVLGSVNSSIDMDYSNVSGIVLDIDLPFTFVLCKAVGYWWVFEKSTGCRIMHECKLRKDAIDLTHYTLKRFTIPQIKISISQYKVVNF